MTIEVKYPVTLASVYLWIGFICAISFMEAWLKFRAPGVTLPIGLGIGRLVFSALNKVEWLLAIAIISSLLVSARSFFTFQHVAIYIPVILLIVQTAWLLPALDSRAQMHIDGKDVPSSYLHFYYVGMEAAKVISLFIFSFKLFK